MQHRLLTVDYQRVAGVVPPLESRHRRGAVRQQVDDLAFALVAPLRADHNYILAHRRFLQDLLTHDKQEEQTSQHRDESDESEIVVTKLGDHRYPRDENRAD